MERPRTDATGAPEFPAPPSPGALSAADLVARLERGEPVAGLVAPSLDLARTTWPGTLDLSGLILTGDLVLANAQIAGDLVLVGTRVAGRVRLTELRADGSILAAEHVAGSLDLARARIGGRLDLSRAHVAGDALFASLELAGMLLAEQARFAGDTSFVDAYLGDEANWSGAWFGGEVELDGTAFHGPAELTNAHFERLASFYQARFDGWADFSGVRHDALLRLEDAEFARGADFSGIDSRGMFDASRARFDGDAYFRDARFDGRVELDRVAFGARVDFRRVRSRHGLRLTQSTCADRMLWSGGHIEGPLDLVQLEATGSIDLSDVVAGVVDLSAAVLRAPLVCDRAQLEALVLERAWLDDGCRARDLVLAGPLVLTGAFLGGTAAFDRARVDGLTRLDGAQIEGEASFAQARLVGGLVLDGAQLEGGLDLGRARIDADVSAVATRFGSLSLAGAELATALDLLRSMIDGPLHLAGVAAAELTIAREQVEGRLASVLVGDRAQAQRDYALLKNFYAEQNRYDEMDWADVESKRAQRALLPATPLGLFRAFQSRMWDLSSVYGTSPLRVFEASLAAIAGFAVLYLVLGLARDIPEALASSLVSFIGSRDIDPATASPVALYALASEAGLGLLLVALFVTTLTRKIVR